MLINIQFLRFAAALAVVFYHAARHVAATGAQPGWVFRAGEAVGFAGVDVFFVISGFIMFYTTREATGTAAAADFFKRRLARIYSGYWPFFIFAAIVFAIARPDHYAEANLFTSFLLWPMPLNKVLLDVSWTLSYEMYFYLLFTLLVLVHRRGRAPLLAGLVVLIAAVNLVRHFLWHDFDPDHFYTLSFPSHFLASPFLLEFFAGALLAVGAARGAVPRPGWLLLLGVLGFTAAGLVNAFVYDGQIEQGYHVVPRVLLFGGPSALILLGLVGLEQNGRVAPRRFSLNTGGASYAIYLSHTILFVATMHVGFNAVLNGWPDLAVQSIFVLYCALIVASNVLYYRYAERPLHRAFKRLLRVSR
jgi:peptidoglycan/LPS O-acetylase OafA/YrhL